MYMTTILRNLITLVLLLIATGSTPLATPMMAQSSAATDHGTLIKATDARFAYTGRIHFNSDGGACWTWPGAQITCQFKGTEATMKTKPGCGYWVVVVDGGQPRKVESTKENNGVVTLASHLSNEKHLLQLTYATEAVVRRPVFYGLMLGKNGTLCDKPQLPTRKMEFIGNSITCALGNEWDGTSKDYKMSMQNIYYSYEAITARNLQARYQVVARSGLGIYRYTCGNVNGDKNVLPTYYPYADFGTSGALWDFSQYQPDVVCVNLGTNDTTSPSWSDEKLQEAFKAFVKTLRSHYPKAKIVLLTGTMIKNKRLAAVQQAQQAAIDDAAKRGDKEVYRFDFTPDDGSLGWGYGRHPSRKRHEQMAAELTPYLQKLMNWN